MLTYKLTDRRLKNIQSTNWQTVRFKPPPPNSSIGWRVEFRSMEVQLTDFENAAFAIFMVLLSRAILCFDLNLYMPITKVDENMQTAQKRDAARKEKFYFRRNVFSSQSSSATSSSSSVDENGNPKPKEKKLKNCFDTPPRATDLFDKPVEHEYELMTLEEIMLGKVSGRAKLTSCRLTISRAWNTPVCWALCEHTWIP